jgi:hypothetical protein
MTPFEKLVLRLLLFGVGQLALQSVSDINNDETLLAANTAQFQALVNEVKKAVA